MARDNRENVPRPFQLLCDGLDAIRGAVDVGILGSAVAGALNNNGSTEPPGTQSLLFTPQQASNALLAPAVTEGAYALIMYMALIKTMITECRQDRSLSYHTLFRLGTALLSTIASVLIFIDAAQSSTRSVYAQIGIPLAAFSIFASRGIAAVYRPAQQDAQAQADGRAAYAALRDVADADPDVDDPHPAPARPPSPL